MLPIIAGRLLSHEGPDCGDGGAVSGGGTHLDGLRSSAGGLWAPHHYFGGLDS